jgi:hypothetical protein
MSDTIGSYGVTYFLIVHRLGELLVAYLWICWFKEKQHQLKKARL